MMKNITKTRKISLIILLIYISIAALSSFIMPYETEDFSHEIMLSPSREHILGTDEMGHDLFSLLINGFRTSIFISLISGVLSTSIGVVLAFISCYYKGKIDSLMLHIASLMLIVPEIIIIMFFAIFSKPSTLNTVMAIAFFSWSKAYKIIRSKLMGNMEKNKVKYTLLIKGNMVDLLKKLYHDMYPVIITNLILQCNKAITYETTMSYFGIGNPFSKTWGKLIKSAMAYENLFYDDVFLWYLLPPIACVFIYVLSLSLLTIEE